MQLEQEGRIWQTIGIISWAAGSGMLALLFKQNGVIRVVDLGVLSAGLTASFLMLAGIAGTVFGRAILAVFHGYQAREARLWRLFALVCCACGTMAVLFTAHQTSVDKSLSLTRVTVGLAGAFLIMAGIICLLGNRVMARATQQFVASHAESPKAASA